jgi:hypothetical protein
MTGLGWVCLILGCWAIYTSITGFLNGNIQTKYGEEEGVAAYIHSGGRLLMGLFLLAIGIGCFF